MTFQKNHSSTFRGCTKPGDGSVCPELAVLTASLGLLLAAVPAAHAH